MKLLPEVAPRSWLCFVLAVGSRMRVFPYLDAILVHQSLHLVRCFGKAEVVAGVTPFHV